MQPSVANFVDPMSVDIVYQQDKCIKLNDVTLLGTDTVELNEYSGKISCLTACQAYNSTMSFALINDHFCTCVTYASLPSVLSGFWKIQPPLRNQPKSKEGKIKTVAENWVSKQSWLF